MDTPPVQEAKISDNLSRLEKSIEECRNLIGELTERLNGVLVIADTSESGKISRTLPTPLYSSLVNNHIRSMIEVSDRNAEMIRNLLEKINL